MKAREWTLVLVLVVAFALRIWHLDAQSLWWDEMATVYRTVQPLSLWLESTHWGNQLPFYYLLLQPWMALGQGAFWLRYPSAWWGVLTIALTYRLAERLTSEPVTTTATALLAVLPLHVRYSQEGRMYSLLGALAVLSYLQLVCIVRDPRDGPRWLGYGAVLLAAVYTHPFGCFLLLAHAAPVLVGRRQYPELTSRWLIVGAVIGLGLLAWFVLDMTTSGGVEGALGWVAEARWYEPVLTFYTFSLGNTAHPGRWWNWLACAALLLAFGWGGRRLVQQIQPPLVRELVICWPTVPMMMMWLLSVRLPGFPERHSMYMDRYVTWLLPCFALFVAWGWERWRRRHEWAWGAAGLYTVTLLISLSTLYTDADYARDDWRSAVRRMNTLAGENAVLVSRQGQLLPLWIYRPSDSVTVVQAPDSLPYGDMASWLRISSRPDELWLITVSKNTNPHGFPQTRNEALDEGAAFDKLKTHLDARYPVAHRHRFPGILLSCYLVAEEVHGS